MRHLRLAVVFVAASASSGCIVYDAAVTARNAVTARVQQLLVDLQREHQRQMTRMARRLSVHTGLDTFAVPDPPRWRTHGGDYWYATPFTEALIFGDPGGVAYSRLSDRLLDATSPVSQLPAAARRALAARLATIDATDAAAMAATNDTGQLRWNGRKQELPAIDALEATVIDPSTEQSATAVLDKISGALLIGARQRQARGQLLAGVVEQLLVDSKRSRDSDAAAMNMQLTTWRDGHAANEAFVAGSGEALRTWRQP